MELSAIINITCLCRKRALTQILMSVSSIIIDVPKRFLMRLWTMANDNYNISKTK
jgi:hypothetical protein